MAQNRTETVTKAAVIAMTFATLAYISTMFLRGCPAILVLDLQASFNASPADVALFSSATLLGYGLMQMPSGLITDAIGGRKTMTLFILIAALATFVFAFAPNLTVGAGARFVTGLTIAAVPPIAAIISYTMPLKYYTRVLGICMAMGGVGFLLASEPLARLSEALGWRYAMAIVAALMVIVAICVYVTVKEPKPEAGAGQKAPKAPVSLKSIGLSMLTVFKTKEFWPLAMTLLFATATSFSFMTMWAGPYLMSAFGMTKVEASRILLIQGIGPIFFIPLIAFIADRIDSRKTMLIIGMLAGFVSSLFLSIFAGTLSYAGLIICIMLFNGCAGSTGTLCFALIGRNFPKEMTGTGTGCVNMFWPVAASLLNVILGVVLGSRMHSALSRSDLLELALENPQAANLAASIEAYGTIMLIMAVMWAIALLIAIFLVRENFTVKVRQ